MSTSGSVFDELCCSTFWMRVSPGTASRSIFMPISVAQSSMAVFHNVALGSEL